MKNNEVIAQKNRFRTVASPGACGVFSTPVPELSTEVGFSFILSIYKMTAKMPPITLVNAWVPVHTVIFIFQWEWKIENGIWTSIFHFSFFVETRKSNSYSIFQFVLANRKSKMDMHYAFLIFHCEWKLDVEKWETVTFLFSVITTLPWDLNFVDVTAEMTLPQSVAVNDLDSLIITRLKITS